MKQAVKKEKRKKLPALLTPPHRYSVVSDLKYSGRGKKKKKKNPNGIDPKPLPFTAERRRIHKQNQRRQ